MSVKWATYNVGASSPEEYGSYFAWGETKQKKDYSWETYKYGSWATELIKYCSDRYKGKDGFTDDKTVLEAGDDAAAVNWSGAWRMPTTDEWKELLNKTRCTWTWTTQNNVKGYKVTGPNGNSIFLPAAGYRSGTGWHSDGYSYYWSSSLNTDNPDGAYSVCFHSIHYDRGGGRRSNGNTVRAVCK